MSSILDMTVRDMLGLMVEGGGSAAKFIARNDDDEMVLVVGMAYEDCEEFAEIVEDFIQRNGETEPEQTIDVDEAKEHTATLMARVTTPHQREAT